MQIYAHGGWSALTFEAVARESGVGKSSLYRRWDSQQTLLHAAMKARWLPVHNIDTGSLHSDLRELAQMIFDNRTGHYAKGGAVALYGRDRTAGARNYSTRSSTR